MKLYPGRRVKDGPDSYSDHPTQEHKVSSTLKGNNFLPGLWNRPKVISLALMVENTGFFLFVSFFIFCRGRQGSP